ncbi:phage portal protein [Mucilaginibacter sabulilitoris]|uniref:Phage portal protein n=1 Tax=Mucilaginibacter sabulilitoris TaxID=1173583 RepID=A0ABZ0TG90_9SPHI|nr:phage portal protein [Mucilaginibacter sabulilitoris]WPU91816.1 phage portal protein [Mucilaginibacter sabulilitoris]
MELSEITSLLSEPVKLVSTIQALAPVIPEYAYDIEPEDHKVVKDLAYRPWKEIDIATGVLDNEGKPTYRTEHRDVHRIPSSTQKQILDWAVRMNLSGGIEIDATIREGFKATDETMVAMLKRTWEDNKLNYTAQKIDRLKKNYTQCLVVWYSVPAEDGFWEGIAPSTSKFKMRCSVFSPEDGDIIIPIYNQYKEMISCARQYTVRIDEKDINKMDLFLSDKYITYVTGTSGWEVEKETLIPYGKANYIYHGQKRPEYADVLPKIERVEEGDSDTADENQISSFPILAATGQITAKSGGDKQNTRKVFEMADGGDLKYVEAKGAQQSATDERKNLRRDIYDETSTPQISMEQLEGSSNIPGVAIELMFLPATNKAKSNQDGDLGMEWQRHLNLLKAAMAVINVGVKSSVSMPVKPKFKIELPRNLTEEYANIVSLVGAGLMSKETAVNMLAFTSDPVAEYDRIKAEAAEAAKLAPVPVTKGGGNA